MRHLNGLKLGIPDTSHTTFDEDFEGYQQEELLLEACTESDMEVRISISYRKSPTCFEQRQF
jgi:hypothetical protein